MKQDETEMVAQQDGGSQPIAIQKEEGHSVITVHEYGFKVVLPDVQQLADAGFEKVARVPAIFDSGAGYARLPSQFLIDRALGVWDPKWRGARLNPQPPTRKSMKNYAYWLCNSLEWAEVRGIELMTADYTTVLIGRYQEEMLKGIWSSHGKPLLGETVNAYVQTALDFQQWCADKKHREPFLVPTVTRTYVAGSHNNSKSHETKTVESRKGKVKVNKRTLSFPTDEEIKAWRQRIYDQPVVGATEGLMVDHILNTGIRREELACWRLETLPLDPKDWQIINPDQPEEVQQVIVQISLGVKGREFYIDECDDKVGPQGNIHVPLWFAKKIHEYCKKDRPLALKQATKGIRDPAKARRILNQSIHLYINPKTGMRYSGEQIYEFWTKVEGPSHWSPHLGRDWWTCQYLWQKMQEHTALIKQVGGIANPDADHPLVRALKDTIQTVIQLEIQPQLRHASSQTTEIYLQWLFNKLRMPLNLTRKWQEEDETAEGRKP
jgi:integrase